MKIGNIEVYGYVYKILNKSNNKVYIGQSCNSFNNRYCGGCWWQHTHNEHLKKSVKKYGVESFEVVEYLDFAFSKMELDIKEKVYIKLYNSIHRDFGYNKRDGGHGKLNDESSKKISVKMLGYDIEDFLEDIISNYIESNMTIRDIAKKYNVNDAVIRRVLVKNKIRIKTSHELVFGYNILDYKDDIINMYIQNKMSLSQISKYFNISVGTVSNNLKKWGIKIRNISESIDAKPKDNVRIWNSNYVTVYDKGSNIIANFESNSKCAEWLVSQGVCRTINSARDGIYQSVKNNRYYKNYKFKYRKTIKLGY